MRTHTQNTPAYMHTHTLAAHASSGTAPQCCTVVRPRCVIERGGLERQREREREREREHLLSQTTNLRKAPVCRSCIKGVFPTEDFLVRPWKSWSGGRRRSWREKKVCWLNRSFHLRGITGLIIYVLLSWWYPTWSSLVDRSLSVLWISLPPEDQSLFSEQSVWMKCAEAGDMSSGRFSHLLRGVWLLWLWQGESSHCLQDQSVFLWALQLSKQLFKIYSLP